MCNKNQFHHKQSNKNAAQRSSEIGVLRAERMRVTHTHTRAGIRHSLTSLHTYIYSFNLTRHYSHLAGCWHKQWSLNNTHSVHINTLLFFSLHIPCSHAFVCLFAPLSFLDWRIWLNSCTRFLFNEHTPFHDNFKCPTITSVQVRETEKNAT